MEVRETTYRPSSQPLSSIVTHALPSVRAMEQRRFHTSRWLVLYVGRLLALAVFLTTGCKVGPDYCGAPIPRLAVSYPSAVTPEEEAGESLSYWWENFNDPVLSGLILQTCRQNLDLRAAYFRVVEARAIRGIAHGGLFPRFNATGSYSYRQSSNNAREFIPIGAASQAYDLFRSGIDASWEIDLFGKLRRGIEAADAELEAAEFSRRDLKVILLADVAINYVNLRVIQRRIAIAQQNLKIQQETLAAVERRIEAGLSRRLDAAQALANVHVTAALIPALEQQQQIALNRLSVLMGQSPDRGLADGLGIGAIPSLNGVLAAGIPADLMWRRPDIRAAERRAAAATARIGVATAELYPQLTLTGDISVDSRQLESWFTGQSISHALGPAVKWNLLSFGRILNNIEAQRARREQAMAEYQAVVLQAVEEVDNGLVNYHTSLERMNELRDAVAASAEAVDLSRSEYTNGLVAFQTVLDTQRQLLFNQENSVISEGAAVLGVIQTYKALGGGWDAVCCDAPADFEVISDEIDLAGVSSGTEPFQEQPAEDPLPSVERGDRMETIRLLPASGEPGE